MLMLRRKASLKLKPRGRLCLPMGAFPLGFNVLRLLHGACTPLMDLPQLSECPYVVGVTFGPALAAACGAKATDFHGQTLLCRSCTVSPFRVSHLINLSNCLFSPS